MSSHDHSHGHGEPKWERWQKERVFVRALVGKYGEVYKQLLDQPRIYDPADMEWKGGPQLFGKKVINPQRTGITQMIEAHVDVYAPGGFGQKHGHMNSALFYILDGKGHDVHDGRRIDWETGDICIVENACVHQHFNDDPERPTKVLIVKAKPLFLFAHMLYQQVVEYPPDSQAGSDPFHPDEHDWEGHHHG